MTDFKQVIASLTTIPGQFSKDTELSVKMAAQALNVSTRSVRMLLEAGILPNLNPDLIVNLSKNTVFAKSQGLQPVLRTGAAGFDEKDNRPIGYSADMSDDDVLEANRKWWRADPEKLIAARYLPISVGGFNVALLGIRGLEESIRVDVRDKNGKPGKEVRHSFDAYLVGRYDMSAGVVSMKTGGTDDTVAALTLLGHFQQSVSGGPIAYL